MLIKTIKKKLSDSENKYNNLDKKIKIIKINYQMQNQLILIIKN